jgi:hypothetical protein
MIIANQRSSEKHKFILVANQYFSLINKPRSLPTYQIGAITELINALYESNLWEKFVAVYPFVGDGSAEKNSLNLIDPYKYKISWSGSIIFNKFGINGNGGVGLTGIKLVDLSDFGNVHLSAYTRTTITNTIGLGRLIGANTQNRLVAIRDVGALEINYNKENGIVGFVYNVLNNSGGFGIIYENMLNNSISGNGFLIANNNNKEKKYAKCYLNGSIFGEQFPLLPTEIHTANQGTLTIFGDGYENTNTSPLRANIAFASIGYGLSDNDIFNFNKIVQSFQVAMNRSVM